jgi:hypothetical protein
VDTVGGSDRSLLERLITRLDADHRMAAVLWGGSHAAGTAGELAPTVTPLDTDAIAAAARAVTEIYLELGPEVAQRSGVEFPSKLVAVVLARLRN